MQLCQLGKTGFPVSRLGFGAMEIRGPRVWSGRPVTDSEVETLLHAVLDAGITFLDTSSDYGDSEAHIGRFLAHRRNEFFLATKCGCYRTDKGDHDEISHVWTRENLLHNIETSLRRLRTDHVDVLQLHNAPVEETDRAGLVGVLEDIRKSGKIRFYGASSVLPHLGTYIDRKVFHTFQIPYSALDRQHELVISDAAASGAGTIIRGGVGQGEPGKGRGDIERWARWDKARLDDLLEEGQSRTAFMLRFTLSHPDVHTVIAGTRNPVHLLENVAVADKGPLPLDVYLEAKRRLAGAGEVPAGR
jgi:aryl-alcohol dehydrogenase-like predicted oxidoreductase